MQVGGFGCPQSVRDATEQLAAEYRPVGGRGYKRSANDDDDAAVVVPTYAPKRGQAASHPHPSLFGCERLGEHIRSQGEGCLLNIG